MYDTIRLPMTRVLLVCADFVGSSMAGPGIRYWELARHLGRHADVILAIPNTPVIHGDTFRIVQYEPHQLRALLGWCDVLVAQGFRLPMSALYFTRKVLVIDLYDPLPLELLEQFRGVSTHRARLTQRYVAIHLHHLLRIGDFFLCAGERQRDFWLGMLAAAGRLNRFTYADDPLFRNLLAVVPFGLPTESPCRSAPLLRGVHPGLGDADRILLWGGGVWEWLDPLTVIRSMERVSAKRNDVKLLFMGLRHPNPGVQPTRMLGQAIALARSLDLEGRSVFFNPDWVPYERRQDALLEADVGVSAHLEHAEARFAFRTRLLDYLWAGLPVVCTRGDELAETIEARGAGFVVAPGDAAGWAETLLRFLDDDAVHRQCRIAAQNLAREMTWPRVLAPLVEFCRRPTAAADRGRRSLATDLAALTSYGWGVGRAVLRNRGLGRVRQRLLGW